MKPSNRLVVWLWLSVALCAVSVCDAVKLRGLRSAYVDIVQGAGEMPGAVTTSENRRAWTGTTLKGRMMGDLLGYPCVLLLGANGTAYGCSRLRCTSPQHFHPSPFLFVTTVGRGVCAWEGQSRGTR